MDCLLFNLGNYQKLENESDLMRALYLASKRASDQQSMASFFFELNADAFEQVNGPDDPDTELIVHAQRTDLHYEHEPAWDAVTDWNNFQQMFHLLCVIDDQCERVFEGITRLGMLRSLRVERLETVRRMRSLLVAAACEKMDEHERAEGFDAPVPPAVLRFEGSL